MNTTGIKQVFDTCTELHCENKIKEVLVLINDKEAIRKQEDKIRLCNKCKESSNLNDDVITLELKKLGLL